MRFSEFGAVFCQNCLRSVSRLEMLRRGPRAWAVSNLLTCRGNLRTGPQLTQGVLTCSPYLTRLVLLFKKSIRTNCVRLFRFAKYALPRVMAVICFANSTR